MLIMMDKLGSTNIKKPVRNNDSLSNYCSLPRIEAGYLYDYHQTLSLSTHLISYPLRFSRHISEENAIMHLHFVRMRVGSSTWVPVWKTNIMWKNGIQPSLLTKFQGIWPGNNSLMSMNSNTGSLVFELYKELNVCAFCYSKNNGMWFSLT